MDQLNYFSVENLYSFGKKVEFSMESTKEKSLRGNLIEINGRLNLSPVAVLYGANASGKTNLIKSINMLKKLIITSATFQGGDEFPLLPFKLLEDKGTTFKIVFLSSGIKYLYYLNLNKERVLTEYLYESPKGRQAKIFHRTFNIEKNKYEYEYSKEKKGLFSSIEGKCLKNRLFFSVLAQWTNISRVINPYMFFKNNLCTNGNRGSQLEDLSSPAKLIEENEEIKNLFLGIFEEINPGIVDIVSKGEKNKILLEELSLDIPRELKIYMKEKEKKKNLLELKTVYSNGMTLDFVEESHGVQKIVKILIPIIKILKEGGVLLLDELETTLYPIIGKKILSLFLNRKINSKGAQIIFSTQDINLLNFNILRKDQIWFLERTRETEFMSTLYSLGSIKGIRKDENIRKNYINGKYSRVPSFSNNSLESFFIK
ncbi:MAG: AAA family ATPase [Fusobacterium sp.]